jgi:cathepsin L
MKYLHFSFIVVVVTFMCAINCLDNLQNEMLEEAKNIFQEWKEKHHKNYLDETDEEKKFQIWLDHKKNIDAHNTRFSQGLETYTMGLHQYHDMTSKEFLALHTGANRPNIKNMSTRDTINIISNASLPSSVNYINLLPPIKNQGRCG